jgi:uracil-DNA glycosylase family 4
VTFLAEALGPEEVVVGRPLQGAAGGVHSRLLTRAGLSREQTRADNVIRCMPPGMWFDEKAPYYYPALSHCAAYRDDTLRQVPDNAVVVTYGAVALRTILNLHGVEGVNVRDWHGTVNRDPSGRFWVVPTFHPSHLQRGAMNLLEVVTNDLRLADRVASTGYSRRSTTLIVDPPIEWFAHWVQDHLTRVRDDPERHWCALDTEFPEKAAGQDESEVDAAAASGSPIIRYNVANREDEGVTVPNTPAYKALIEQLLVGIGHVDGFIWYWNKYADIDHLLDAGHTVLGANHVDLMWLLHYLQSDLPRGLGFWAPIFSDFGPWKHWSHDPAKFGAYAAADALQTFRGAVWAVKEAYRCGMWEIFYRDWHERDCYVLRPSREVGVPMNRQALEAFHADLQQKQARILSEIKQIGAEGTLRPKGGYAKKPKAKSCPECDGSGRFNDVECLACAGTGNLGLKPPKSLLGGSGSKGKRKSEAKAEYLTEGVRLVERCLPANIRVCHACGKGPVGPRHFCTRAKSAGYTRDTPNGPSYLYFQTTTVTRWFWAVPFNPSSWQQILAYIEGKGHVPGKARKTRKPTTDADSLKKLAAETGDPLYQLLLDGRAVEKADSTYAVGSLSRLDGDNRLHPEIAPKPSTLRDSSAGPNLQNVIADKSGKPGLATGFRVCVQARDGIPPDTSEEEVDGWARRWGV